jgi:SAM-dependent methyltransferase
VPNASVHLLALEPGSRPERVVAVGGRRRSVAAPPTDVLEVGCGQGGFAVRLSERYRYLGIEPDERSFAVAKARLHAHRSSGVVRKGDLAVLAPGEMFDLVCAFEVLEHIEDDQGAISAWVEHLRPGGLLIVSAPAWRHRFAAADEMVGHFRRYNPPEVRELLAESGLVGVEVMCFGAPFGYVLEAIRNALGTIRRAKIGRESQEARTAASGRLMRWDDGLGAFAVFLLMQPFRKLQRAFPNHGPSMIAVGRRPEP